MCNKCFGRGVTYSQPMAGVYQLTPCSCKQSIQDRQAVEQRMKKNRKRIEDAHEKFFGIREQSTSENQSLLSN